ncbi:MAG TPA: type II toxin-antitoxin system VapC family toxin [Candidatus Limnocylindria bacterium]|nr:type II toxin-antitoxin system VapC family toxin [Candidatus Limnocylindria bacterium]
MILFFDTSAFVKLLIREAGSPEVLAAARDADTLAAARLLEIESRSFIGRRLVARLIDARHARLLRADLATWLAGFAVVELDEVVASTAGDVAERHALRGMDAVHLAGALRLAAVSAAPVVLASYDSELRDAATRENLGVFPG